MEKLLNAKCTEFQKAMRDLGERLDREDISRPFIEVIPGKLFCSYRPLRRHHNPDFRGPQMKLPADAASEVLEWIRKMRAGGIQTIISLMSPRELGHYATVCSKLGAGDLYGLYKSYGFAVESIAWEDPMYRVGQGGRFYKDTLLEIRQQALDAFDRLQKPVLLHCSSGIQRSSPVAAFIYAHRCKMNTEGGSGH